MVVKKSLLKGFGFIQLVEKTEKKNQTKIIKDICGGQKWNVLRVGVSAIVTVFSGENTGKQGSGQWQSAK